MARLVSADDRANSLAFHPVPRDPARLRAFGRWMAERIVTDPRYISHGELQAGLSLDGLTWRTDLAERFETELLELTSPDAPREAFEALADDGARVAGAIVLWVPNDATPHAVLEDLTVDPARRSDWIGAAFLAWLERQATLKGARWLFLESGIRNDGAHRFFERHGFAPISRVFAKKL
jgi:GNAT superfamily N-acetyltransferase